MHQRISKKIIIYLFFFLILVSINNIHFLNLKFPNIITLNFFGLSDQEIKIFKKEFNFLKKKNLLFLDEVEIKKIFYSNNIVEDLTVFKTYPSELKIFIKKTKIFAITKKDNRNYLIGSNGNLIATKNMDKNLPFIFGNVEPDEFLKLKNYIDDSDFNFNQIKDLYFFKSKRWDIETKDGLIVKLPLTNIEKSLNYLSKIMISEKFNNKKVIDLRQKNQIIFND
tara:strand:+ start:13498 stop:14169 length:672 start_codon:yes stop_codon:yes gene_type:complete